MDFKKFMKNRSKMSEGARKLKDKKPSFVDERFWGTSPDKLGNANAVIRFLPQQDPEKEPFILKYVHGFKKNGKWFFADCPTTISEPCPADEFAQPFWDKDTEESRGIASFYSRKKQYIANILVVNDLAKPENNGKVFLFKFGQKIMDKVMSKLAPESELDEPVIIYDFIDGLNFKLKQRKVSGWVNYDSSEFYGNSTPIAESEEDMEKIFNQIRNLDEFVDPKKFSSYTDLKKKFISIVGTEAAKFFSGKKEVVEDEENITQDKPEDTECIIDEEEYITIPEEIEESEASEETTSDEEDEVDESESNDDFDFDFDDDDDFNFDE